MIDFGRRCGKSDLTIESELPHETLYLNYSSFTLKNQIIKDMWQGATSIHKGAGLIMSKVAQGYDEVKYIFQCGVNSLKMMSWNVNLDDGIGLREELKVEA